MTTYTFGPDIYKGMANLPVFNPLSRQEEISEPQRLFGFRIECDPTLPPWTAEIRGVIDGKPYVRRIQFKPE